MKCQRCELEFEEEDMDIEDGMGLCRKCEEELNRRGDNEG